MATTTPSRKSLSASSYCRAKNVYLAVFDSFAASKSDIAEELNLTKGQVSGSLKTLETAGLVCATDVNESAQGTARQGQYGELVWQCYQTYDSIERDEA